MEKKRFISFSGGVESTTMCLLYGKGATAIWCDTGWEHKEMYKRIDQMEAFFTEYHNGDFTLIRIKARHYIKGRIVKKLQTAIKRYMYMPSIRARYCTKMFKIQPIDRFLKEQGECELLIGFNSDEDPGTDRTGNFMECQNVSYRYLLHEEGRDRESCELLLLQHHIHPDFPPYMQRGGCEGCFFKSIPEWKAMYFFDRPAFNRNRALEESVQGIRKKFFSLNPSGRSLASIAEECERELSLWGWERIKAMYQSVKPSQSCGAFCHR